MARCLGCHFAPSRKQPQAELWYPSFRDTAVYGGTGGRYFLTSKEFACQRLTAIEVYADSYIRGFKTEFGSDYSMAGSNMIAKGAPSRMTFEPGESINQVIISSGTRIDWISVRTNRGNERRFGLDGGGPVTLQANPGHEFIGFRGFAGTLVDQLGMIERELKPEGNLRCNSY